MRRSSFNTNVTAASRQPARDWNDTLTRTRRWLVLVMGLSGAAIAAVYAQRKRRRRRCRQQGPPEPQRPNGHPPRPPIPKTGSLSDTFAWDAHNVDIGAVLGVDIGGTLSKLVYFEKKPPSLAEAQRRPSGDPMGQKVEMKRTRSLGNLHDTMEQQEALQHFYTFMGQASRLGESGVLDSHLRAYSHALGGYIHFFHFETRFMDHAIEIISMSQVHRNIQVLGCTGGGAFKFESSFLQRLGVTMVPMDEMECLVRGMQFALANIPDQCFTYQPPAEEPEHEEAPIRRKGEDTGRAIDADGDDSEHGPAKDSLRNKRMREVAEGAAKREYTRKVARAIADEPATTAYPALVVSLGSGVSIIKVDGPAQFKRVSGSSIGGGTYWGLCRLLTGASNYDESLQMASQGESDKVDMLVGDIYGRDYNKFQLSSNTLASSFGKIGGMTSPRGPYSGVMQEDLAKALLVMITMNIGQVAYLNAKLFDTRRIYFVGNFLRQNRLSGQQLAFAIDYWSSGEMEALFLEHEGYCGALGSFLMSGTEEPGSTRVATPSGAEE